MMNGILYSPIDMCLDLLLKGDYAELLARRTTSLIMLEAPKFISIKYNHIVMLF